MDGNLNLPLKRKWFELTKAGRKTEDYREITPYWFSRLIYLRDPTVFSDGHDVEAFLDELKHPFSIPADLLKDYEIEFRRFKRNVMTLGYPKSTDKGRRLTLKHAGIEIRTGDPDLGAEPGKRYFVIKHKMGLNVGVYQNIRETTNEHDSDFTAEVYSEEWSWKIKNLKQGAFYCGDLVDRSIEYAYSYHTYFRARLIALTGKLHLLNDDGTIKWNELPNDMPFIDFIDFADNWGCLDFEVSEKIYQDFNEWKSLALLQFLDYEYLIYQRWLNAFDLARKNGVVVFR